MRKSVAGGLAVLLIVTIVVLGFYAMGMFDSNDVLYVNDLDYSIGEFSFTGCMKDGLFSGPGTVTLKNGDVFTGDFNKGRFSGDGAYSFSGAAGTGSWRFDGVFDNGRVSSGVFYSADGSMVTVSRNSTSVSLYGSVWQYNGGFNERGQNGAGSFIFDDGSIYTGGFINGLANGDGEFIDASGNIIYTGRFENGSFNGRGAYFSPDGWSYEGEFKDGQFDGEGIVTDGELIVRGIWEKGVQIERYE